MRRSSALNQTTVEQALYRRFGQADIYPWQQSMSDWYKDNWIHGFVFGLKIPLFPIYRGKQILRLHDVHHVITGYGTDLKGELELVAWELGCDGIGDAFLRILHRLFFLPFCLLLYPTATGRAFRRGLRCRSFFRQSVDKILECRLCDIQRRLE